VVTVYQTIPPKQGLKLENIENRKMKVYQTIPPKQGLKE